jgi:hypothetical protein
LATPGHISAQAMTGAKLEQISAELLRVPRVQATLD